MALSNSTEQSSYALALVSIILSSLSFFLIVLWWLAGPEPKGDQLNALAWSLSVLQTMIALVAFGGFWLIRNAAIAKAQEEAKSVAEKIAKEISEPVARRTAEDYLATLNAGQTPSANSAEMQNALDQPGEQ